MIKKISLSLILILMIGVFTGCEDAIPDLSDDEMQMVEEYAANLLLKYDKNYKSNILSEEEIEKQKQDLEQKAELQIKVQELKEAEAAEEAAAAESDSSNAEEGGESSVAEPVYANIAEFLGFDNISIDFANMVVSDKYPNETEENDWQGIAAAASGNKLVVCEFNVTNNGSDTYNLDFISKGIKASVKVDNRYTKAPLTTLLSNDMLFYRGELEPGASTTLVLLIEVSDDIASSMSSAVLTLKCNGEKMETSLL